MKTITLELQGTVPVGAIRITDRVAAVAAMFGLAAHESAPRMLFQPLSLTLSPGDVVLITGPSGSGKSTLLRAIAAQVDPAQLQGLPDIALPADIPAVDCFLCPLDQALAHLSRAGLSDAHLLLRAPAEFSEGQQFRYRLAQFFASDKQVLIADEFAALLDRLTAKVVAYQAAKCARTAGKILLLATTHEDLNTDVAPSCHIHIVDGCAEMKIRN